MQPEPMKATEVSLPQEIAKWVPSLTVVDGWQEKIPLPFRQSAQIISDTTGEAPEIALATSLCVAGALLRRRRMIVDSIGKYVYPEINCLLIRKDHHTRLNWFYALCVGWLNVDSIEHALQDHMDAGRIHDIQGVPVCARRSITLSEPRPSQIKSILVDASEPSTILLHSLASSLSDEFSNFTALEIRELTRLLGLSWQAERLGDGRGAHIAALCLLWSITKQEFPSIRSAFLDRLMPAPILVLESQTATNVPCATAIEPFDEIIGRIWQSSLHNPKLIPITTEQLNKIHGTANAIENEIATIPHPGVRTQLHWMSGLYMRIAMLFVFLSDDESLEPVDGALQLTGALTQRHYETLRKFTDDFTAPSEPITESPAQVLAEYELLAKIDHLAPVSRSDLNRRYSNGKRKQLDTLLARLLRDGRIMVDAQKRFSVRSLVSV